MPFDDLVVSVFANKLDIDGWAPFNDLVEASRGMSHSVTDAIMKSGFRNPVQHNNSVDGMYHT